jgi:hypothetical protein
MKYKKVFFFGCKEKGKVVEGPPQLAPRAVGFLKKSNATRVIPENCTTTKKIRLCFGQPKNKSK